MEEDGRMQRITTADQSKILLNLKAELLHLVELCCPCQYWELTKIHTESTALSTDTDTEQGLELASAAFLGPILWLSLIRYASACYSFPKN